MENVNYYRLNKRELSFVGFIEAPVVSQHFGRLSRPVVLVHKSSEKESQVLHVWTLSWFKHKVISDSFLIYDRYIEIRSML